MSSKRISRERLDVLKQSPRQADVTDVEDLCDEVERLNGLLEKDSIRTREHNILVQENRQLRAALERITECPGWMGPKIARDALENSVPETTSSAGDSGLTGQGRTPGNVTEAPVRFSKEGNL